MSEAEHEKYEMAVDIVTLSYSLDVANHTIPELLAGNTLDMLIQTREDLLTKIDEQVSLDGFYEVPAWMDAAWLATLLQTEFGSYVAAGEHGTVKAIVLVDPS